MKYLRAFRSVLFSAALLLAGFFCAHSEAIAKKPLFGPEFGKGHDVSIELITNYYPTRNDKMNGKCGAGGGTAPKDPCKHLLEDVVDGKSPCVVAATQRYGGSAPLYGCMTVVPHISSVVGKDINVCFADVYADSENEGQIGVGKKRNPAKFDLAVKDGSKMGAQIQKASASPVKVGCNGRVPNTQPNDRKIDRKDEATSPMAGGPPPGGGGAPPSSQPESKPEPSTITGATSPTPASTNTSSVPKDNGGVKIGADKVALKPSVPGGTSPEKNSGITKDDNRSFPSGASAISEDVLSMANNSGASSPGSWKSASASSASGGSFGGGGESSSARNKSEAGAEAKSASSDSSAMGSGGGGGDSGGGSSSSPFSASSSSATKTDEEPVASLDGPAADEGEVAGSMEEGSRDPASEVVDGVGSRYSASVFDRVHNYFSRERRGRAQ